MNKKEKMIYEEKLNLWLLKKTCWFSLKIDRWYKNKPKIITISLMLKTSDGIDMPYWKYPPDEKVINALIKNNWKNIQTDKIVIYENLRYCKKCGIVSIKECELPKNKRKEIHKKCGSKVEEVIGNRWICGSKTIKLKGNESEKQIKKTIIETVKEIDFCYKNKKKLYTWIFTPKKVIAISPKFYD
ncbi:MAG: hypothetical protein QXP52_02640 [Candidatus Aenigmatarchaeota archaeon]